MRRFSKVLRRVASRTLNEEIQADAFAFCTMLEIGATDDLQAILTQYPEKTWVFCLCAFASIYTGIKRRIQRVIQGLFQPFSA
jgi:hypothetical protein